MLAPWKEGYDKPRQHINKQRHQFADKGSYNQSYVFSSHHVWMCEWTIKKAEHQIIDASELWRLRVPWTARRSNQSILKEINPKYSLEGLMLKLKLQYFGHLMRRANSLEKTDAGKDWRQMEKGVAEDGTVRWHHRLSEHEFEQTPGDSGGQRSLVCCSPWNHKKSDTA